MTKYGIVYKVTSPSGKCYIGKTTQPFRKRRSRHVWDALTKDSKFMRAIKKYGALLCWEILYDGVPVNFLSQTEQFAIGLYDSFDHGYNSTLGGEGLPGRKHTEETKRKIGQANRGKQYPARTLSEETKRKISFANSGRRHSDATRLKISQAVRANPRVFTEAEKERLVLSMTGNKYCVGKRNHAGHVHSEETRRKMSDAWVLRKNRGGKQTWKNK